MGLWANINIGPELEKDVWIWVYYSATPKAWDSTGVAYDVFQWRQVHAHENGYHYHQLRNGYGSLSDSLSAGNYRFHVLTRDWRTKRWKGVAMSEVVVPD